MEILIIFAALFLFLWILDSHRHGATRHSHSYRGPHTHDEIHYKHNQPAPYVPLVRPTSPLEQKRLDEQRRVRDEELSRFNPKAGRQSHWRRDDNGNYH